MIIQHIRDFVRLSGHENDRDWRHWEQYGWWCQFTNGVDQVVLDRMWRTL